MFELLSVVPFVVVIVGAFYSAGDAKRSGQKLSRAATASVWALAIIVPLISQYLVEAMLFPFFCYFLCAHVLGMPLSVAEYINDLIWRTTGALIGIFLVRRYLLKKVILRRVRDSGQAS